ncbi:DUF3800 domain-containing protein [Sphingomonas sp. ERG5]|uniref:DUF3800 domain-containing protein n=1 Tax=Sphingomonas sp. ERG5 TaxID=1381597 RepID=UPI00054B4437|nr:DUF3800 domain-containing protein [Sphingomonas sp. ERG5]
MATTIYCDDAGFTGDKLLDTDQPFFGYSAVAIEPDAAALLVQEFRTRFGVLGAEIKGRQIYKRSDALEVVRWLSERLGDRATVVVNDKLFSLACKFFEYIYEPVLAPNNMFFYEREFHLHVANIIWSHLRFGDNAAAHIADRFQKMLSRKPGESAEVFAGFSAGTENAIATINRFIEACRPQIEAEVASLADADGRIQWVLDLSLSSAMSVLRVMGERHGQLDVIFDQSKPLLQFRDFFDEMIGREDIPYMTMRGRSSPLVVNLAGPIEFGSSASLPGLQLADMIASISALASRDRHMPRGRDILDVCFPWFNEDSVWPDIDQLRIERKPNFLNTIMMIELTRRAESGEDLLRRMPQFYNQMSMQFDVDPPPFLLEKR